MSVDVGGAVDGTSVGDTAVGMTGFGVGTTGVTVDDPVVEAGCGVIAPVPNEDGVGPAIIPRRTSLDSDPACVTAMARMMPVINAPLTSRRAKVLRRNGVTPGTTYHVRSGRHC